MHELPAIDPGSPLQFVINGAAGSSGADARRDTIQAALDAAGRPGVLHFCEPGALAGVAREAADTALRTRTAVVAVGGDGTINTVAQAAHAVGCAMGVVPQGTFNYFARTHGIPAEPAEAVAVLLAAAPVPVRVAAINHRVFLVNASLGLYPDLLEDREAFKARFGRSRWVAMWAGAVTLLRAQRQLNLHIERSSGVRDVRALTLFVGNNRLQLEQLGVAPPSPVERAAPEAELDERITAVMLKPIGTLAMLRLMLHGAMGNLGDAESVERFDFRHLVVRPGFTGRRRGVKVAFDGEVTRMQAPLDFRVLEQPLYLMKPGAADLAIPAVQEAGQAVDREANR